MNYIRLPLALSALLMLSAPQSYAFCLFNCKDATTQTVQTLHLNETESSEQQETKRQALVTLQEEMIAKFTSIEEKLNEKNASSALNEAKQVLDTVRVKTGIDPKTKIVESFLVATVFPEAATSIQDLGDQQKELVIRAVSEFRGGLYMDIMNLSKRTTLLYIKAFKAVVQAQGGMTKDDQKKIVNDLVKASLVPMTIEDKKGKKIIAFDEDIANEDHTYLFNRELKMYLASETDLGVTEDAFDSMRTHMKASFIPTPVAPKIENTGDKAYVDARACMDRASAINYTSNENAARITCFRKYYTRIATFSQCSALASSINYTADENRAQENCFDHFNK